MPRRKSSSSCRPRLRRCLARALQRRRPDLRAYVAALEAWLIATLEAYTVRGERREDRVGVWVRRPEKGPGVEDKIAAIGIRVRRWVTFHGVSINVSCDLSHFAGIVPCGISDARYGVTSLEALGGDAWQDELDRELEREPDYVVGTHPIRTDPYRLRELCAEDTDPGSAQRPGSVDDQAFRPTGGRRQPEVGRREAAPHGEF